MSILVPSNIEAFLHLLHKAVLSNTFRPRPKEEQALLTSRTILCSPEVEGDSQLALTLFFGIANTLYGIRTINLADYLGVELHEVETKVAKFQTALRDASALPKYGPPRYSYIGALSFRNFDVLKALNKTKLIKRYIELYAKQYGVLFQRRSIMR
jgi:hypothetical protein